MNKSQELPVKSSPKPFPLFFIVLAIVLFLTMLFVGKYLWNDVLVYLLPTIRKIDNIYQVFGLMLLFSILFGSGLMTTTCYNKCIDN